MQSTSKLELKFHDRLNRMRFTMKIRRDNDVTDHIGMIFAKYDTELSRPIGQCAVYVKM